MAPGLWDLLLIDRFPEIWCPSFLHTLGVRRLVSGLRLVRQDHEIRVCGF